MKEKCFALLLFLFAVNVSAQDVDSQYASYSPDGVPFEIAAEPWVADGLRIHPDQDVRKAQAEQLKAAYRELGYELIVLDGDYRENYERALLEIRALLGYEEGEV